MTTKSDFFKMDDGFEIWVTKWIPDDIENIKGGVQLHHGLAEHSMRYDRLGSVLSENGYVLSAYDMRGHGRTAENALSKKTGMFGKLSDKNGFKRAVEDLRQMIENDKKEFSGKKIFLLGHSFGSFVSQGFIEKYGSEINGCILCGTAGPMKALVNGGCVLTSLAKALCGGDSLVPLLEKVTFGGYNKRIKNPLSKVAWLSASESNLQIYDLDSWCGIPLTASFFYDMAFGLKLIHKNSSFKKIPKKLPVFFIYGEEDPVGGYGKTVKNLFKIYLKNGLKNLSIKSYEGDRHEILNEDDRDTVEKDIISWLNGLL